MPIIVLTRKPYHGRSSPSQIKDVGGPPTGRCIAPINNDGGEPFSNGGNGPPWGGGGGPPISGSNEPPGDQNPKSFFIRPTWPWIGPTENPWYPPSWYPIQPLKHQILRQVGNLYSTPIYIVGINPNVHVPIFRKAIPANRDKNDVDIINLLCFNFHDAIFEWGENFMKAHPVGKFEKLEATFCKCYRKI